MIEIRRNNMNLGKPQGWDNLPYRYIFLSTGERIGIVYDGIDFVEDDVD